MDNLVLSNMMHRPARTIVSVLGIALGVLLIVFTVGLSNGSMRERGKREANVGAEIMFRPSGSLSLTGAEAFRMPLDMVEPVSQVEGVANVVPVGQNSVAADDSNTGSRFVDGINFTEYAAITGITMTEGRPLGDGGEEAIIDAGFKRQRKYSLGATMRMYDKDYKIVGIYEPAAGSRVKIPIKQMQTEVGGDGKVSMLLVKVKDGFDVNKVAENLNQKFPDNQIILTSELEEFYMQGVPALNIFLNVFIGVAAVVSGLVILLTMYTTVSERTRQIGVLKALGMSNAGISWTITQEALLISFLGVVFGVIITYLVRAVLQQTTSLEVEISLRLILLTLVIGLIGGAVGAVYPALRAARLDAVDALSYE